MIMKDSGIDWIGKIPANWELARMKNVGEYINGYAFKPEDWSNHGLPIIRIQDLTGSNENPNYYDAELDNKYKVLSGDILISWAATLDAFIWKKHTGWLNQHIFKAIPNINKIEKSFFIFLVKEAMSNMNNDNKHGIVMQHVTLGVFNNFKVPLPPIQEQKIIADYLDNECARIDDIVEKQRNIIEKLKEYKKSVITEAVTRGLNSTAPMKDSGIEWIGKIPEQWQIKKLKYVLYQRNEKISDVSLKYIGLENIISFSNKYMNTNNISEPSSMNNICKKGDILFGKLRPYLAKCIISDFDGMCSGEFLVLYNCRGVVSYYHYLLLSHWFLDMVNSSTYGTKMPRANWDFIGSMFLPEPNIKEQRAIADYLDQKCAEIDSVVEKRERMIDLLAEYKKSLIYECVTGKKEVA